MYIQPEQYLFFQCFSWKMYIKTRSRYLTPWTHIFLTLKEIMFYVESISKNKRKTALLVLCSFRFLNIHVPFPSTTIFFLKKIIGNHKFSLNKMYPGRMIIAHTAMCSHFINIGQKLKHQNEHFTKRCLDFLSVVF